VSNVQQAPCKAFATSDMNSALSGRLSDLIAATSSPRGSSAGRINAKTYQY